MIKLITTDSYFNLFNILNSQLKGSVNTTDCKNLIFCEEKCSLLAERSILAEYKGTLNTFVYSFGNYLRLKKPNLKTLTKEGSAMAVKRILSKLSLDCLKASKTGLAPTLYDLIIQFKSAKVTPDVLDKALSGLSGTLRSKLKDVCEIYSEYEKFVSEEGLDDQSSFLNYLPDVIENDQEMKDTNVYLVGYNGFTCQLRQAISSLMQKAKGVTAILVKGQNSFAYVNETAEAIKDLAKSLNLKLEESRELTDWGNEGGIIAKGLFNPVYNLKEKLDSKNVHFSVFANRMQEAERVAEVIKNKVLNNECRYKDLSVCIPDLALYRDDIERAFNMLEIPYFIDEKRKLFSAPLIRLIVSYIDATRKNLSRDEVCEFFKNPLFNSDKELADRFENYLLKYNVNYTQLKKPFTLASNDENLQELNAFRESIVLHFEKFSVNEMLERLNVETKSKEFSELLTSYGEVEESALNEQVYKAVTGVLSEMQVLLNGVEMSLSEYKNVFLSGVSATELSIIPQYNDAVFVGGFKEIAFARTKTLFVLGLTSEVPIVREDVALLTDGDINVLEEVKVLVEPKIKIVNHRAREQVALALGAFTDSLYISYPLCGTSGEMNCKSEVVAFFEDNFKLLSFPEKQGYLTKKQGLKNFALSCGEFASGKINEFSLPSSYYHLIGEKQLKYLLDSSDSEIKIRLDGNRAIMQKEKLSPTRIEDYYKCPYRSFLSSCLKLKRREEGVVDGFSIGNLMHEIFGEYLTRINEITDWASSVSVVEDIKNKLFEREEYKRYLSSPDSLYNVESAVKECAKFCYKNYLSLKTSKFKVVKTEVSFGEGGFYPAISFLDGKVKLVGKIDRIDESEKYFRILDYKTVSPNADPELLFTGKKMQLYLYGAAVMGKPNYSKSLAGVYYMPVNDNYRTDGEKEPVISKGLTLADSEVLSITDENIEKLGESLFLEVDNKGENCVEGEVSEQGLQAMVEYALKLSEQAIEQMRDGVIVPSPADERICSYCDYRSMCNAKEPKVRKNDKIDVQVIIDSLQGGEECPN